MVKNQIVPQGEKGEKQEKTSFSAVINKPAYQKAILNALSDHKAVKRFTASIVSAVTSTPQLQECDPMSIVSAGLLGESLNLSPSQQLGHYYFVPFKNKATFVLGYKGYIQLATRSGYYRKINVLPIKKGELISFNPLEEEIKAEIIQDETERENASTIGYYAMFEYLNGFRKAIYWSRQKMLSYADRYSANFSLEANGNKVSFADYEAGNYNRKDEWKYSGHWYKDFDGMACKTMLRQLIGKWGIMSIEMQRAYEADMGVISENGSIDYVDAPTEKTVETPPPEKPAPTEIKETYEDSDQFSTIMNS
ncbi:MAG: recombinase [Ruminococcus sp.]|nr:recombinase [Ruminococcus sp.]